MMIYSKVLINRGVVCFITIILSCILSSCVYDSYDADTEEGEDVKGMIVLRVNTVDAQAGTTLSQKVNEKIQSLRLIILNDGYVEVNEFFEINDHDASDFVYQYSKPYIKGNRKFFFIANEKILTSDIIQYQAMDGATLPFDITGKSFSEIMSLYPADITGKDDEESGNSASSGKGLELENILNAIYFQPNYNIIYDTASDKGSIYLPYSVFYNESDIIKTNVQTDEDGNLEGYSATMHLVPVATKFEFHFINQRSNPVELSDLKVTQFDNLNFLLAHVGKKDTYKTLPEEKNSLYWPDWLATVSEESWNHIGSSDANNTFNTLYGWISEYDLPNGTSPNPVTFPVNETPRTLTIPACSRQVNGEERAGELDLGPYYLPESKNIVDGKHWYGLYFKLKDTKQETEFEFSSDNKGTPMSIENIGALFRNTHVVITVEMGEGESIVEGVYAELMPFINKSGWGYVGDYIK